jgi:hypothetical protein
MLNASKTVVIHVSQSTSQTLSCMSSKAHPPVAEVESLQVAQSLLREVPSQSLEARNLQVEVH